MVSASFNKFRSAMEILQRGREQLVEEIADEVLDRSEDFAEAPYLFNEFLENQGTKLHFLGLLVSQMELSADELEEHRLTLEFERKASSDLKAEAGPAPKSKTKAKTKQPAGKSPRARSSSSSKKLSNQQSASHRKPNADES